MSVTLPEQIPLESGDRLSRDEFHRRYCARPDIRRAELVQGVVYVPSPARFRKHSRPHGLIVTWLGTYAFRSPDVEMGPEATVYLDDDSEVQPDACLFRVRHNSGARITDDDYVEGAPELVAEIVASSAAYDLHDKLEAYQRAGVKEYIVWQIYENQFIWLRLRDGRYEPLTPDANGIIESVEFPGLRLNVQALLAGDRSAVLDALGADTADDGSEDR